MPGAVEPDTVLAARGQEVAAVVDPVLVRRHAGHEALAARRGRGQLAEGVEPAIGVVRAGRIPDMAGDPATVRWAALDQVDVDTSRGVIRQ